MPLRLLVICPLLKAVTSPTSCGKPRSRRIQALYSPRRQDVLPLQGHCLNRSCVSTKFDQFALSARAQYGLDGLFR